jgi:hypothetical protein
MSKRRASLGQIALHIEECADALQAKIEAMDDTSQRFNELKRSAEFLMSGIVFLRETCQTKRR